MNTMRDQKPKLLEAMRLLRKAGDILEALPDKTVLFPGWDESCISARVEDVRIAASAVAADDIGFDDGTRVSPRALGALTHYIADMMEE